MNNKIYIYFHNRLLNNFINLYVVIINRKTISKFDNKM